MVSAVLLTLEMAATPLYLQVVTADVISGYADDIGSFDLQLEMDDAIENETLDFVQDRH